MKSLKPRRGAALFAAHALACALAFLAVAFCAEIDPAHADTKSVLREFGLIGTYSQDCSAVRDGGDYWERFEIPQTGDATVISHVKEGISRLTITRAQIIGDNQVKIEGKLGEDRTKYEIVLERSDHGVRILQAIKDAGAPTASTLIDDGKVAGTAVSVTWEQRCGQPQAN